MVTSHERTSRIGIRFASVAAITLGLSFGGCAIGVPGDDAPTGSNGAALTPDASTFPSTFARQWLTNVAFCIQNEGHSPPVAAREYAYTAIAAYEAVVNGMPGYHSLAGQLNGLTSLPQPTAGTTYDWPTVLAATEGRVVNGIYIFRNALFFEYTTSVRIALGSLEQDQVAMRLVANGVPQAVSDASVAYGHALGDALVAWANADGYSEERYLAYAVPNCAACWQPTGFQDLDKITMPVEPHFGNLRPLALSAPEVCMPPAPPPFSTDPSSVLYAQAQTVWQTDQNLTEEQRTIAEFWADPSSTTPTPPGHWINLTSQIIRPMNLADAVNAYAYVGIGVLDSFIAIWNAKYYFNLLRPETYIRNYIDPTFRPRIGTPQFPEYISGHSGVSATSATLLTSVFGSGPITDSTKLRRGFGPRSFPNFFAAAQEAANSRLYGGIHFPVGNSEGLTLGSCVANNILARVHLH